MNNQESPLRIANPEADADHSTQRRDYSDIDLPECLFIKAIRLWVHGPENWSLIGIQYQAHFGQGAASVALLALKGIIEILNSGARRQVQFHKVWSRRTTGDERTLVALMAATQAGDRARARALADWLVGPPLQSLLLDQIENLAAAFTHKGHRFVLLTQKSASGSRAKASKNHATELWMDAGD